MRIDAPDTFRPKLYCHRKGHDTSWLKLKGLYLYPPMFALTDSSLESTVAFRPEMTAPTSVTSPYRCGAGRRPRQRLGSNSPNRLITLIITALTTPVFNC